jgi:putative endonuclease
MEKTYYVYIMASQRRVLYIGITSHIERRVHQHKSHTFGGFTAKYNVTNLVYFERYSSVGKAIRREKEPKDWRGEKLLQQAAVRFLFRRNHHGCRHPVSSLHV